MKAHYFRFIFFFAVFFFIQILSNAQVDLRVIQPQWWETYQGSIDEASLVVKPKGIYMEVSMYLTFSAQETYFAPDDTVEVVLDFNLPEDAIVHDSWLWIEDEIIKADIIDRWTASDIYEEIVDRRQDPSIFFKNSATEYQLRIYPMVASGSRKVKLSYLVPTKWRENEVLADLPYEIFNASYVPLEQVEIITYLDPEWSEPQIKELEGMSFQAGVHPSQGPFWAINAPMEALQSGMTFSVKSPLEDGLYTNRFADGNIYQMVFSPAEIFDISSSEGNDFAFVLSHYPYNSNNLTEANILYQLHQMILSELSEGDRFNIFMSGSGEGVSEDWIPFSLETVNAVFGELFESGIPANNGLFALLSYAVDYINANGNNAEIISISNSQAEGWVPTANGYIDLLLEQMGDNTIPVHIVDYQNANFDYYWWDWNDYLTGNEYFYNNLSRFTGGSYDRVGALNEKLRSAIVQAGALYGTLDLYTTLEDGFCYQRYNLGTENDLINLKQPILQVGKYQGAFPLKIIANGFFEGNAFSAEIDIPAIQTHEADTLAEEVWAGRYIHTLESNAQTNQNIGEIIDRSISERVLSLYTAFLCLEPSLGGEPCLGCIDETDGEIWVVDNHEITETPLTITAYPNPFAQYVRLRLEFEKGLRLDDYRFGIYNGLGQLVKGFDLDNLDTSSGELELTWDAEAACVPGGIYFFVVENGSTRQTFKLVYLD